MSTKTSVVIADRHDDAAPDGRTRFRKVVHAAAEAWGTDGWARKCLQLLLPSAGVVGLVCDYVGPTFCTDAQMQLIVWHESLSASTVKALCVGQQDRPPLTDEPRQVGGYEIMAGPFGCTFDRTGGRLAIVPLDRRVLFPLNDWQFAHGSKACHCGDNGHVLELQWRHKGHWWHLWEDHNDTAYHSIPVRDPKQMKWNSDGSAVYGEFTVQQTQDGSVDVVAMNVELFSSAASW